MIGMARLPIGKDDGVRAQFADDLGKTQLVRTSGLDIGIRHGKRVAPGNAKKPGRGGCFLGAGLWCAASSHFALGEIKDTSLITDPRHFQERASASQLDIVGVSGDGQQVQFHR